MVVEYWKVSSGVRISHWLKNVDYCCEKSSQLVSTPRVLKKLVNPKRVVYIGSTKDEIFIDYCPYCGAQIHVLIK